MIKEKLEQIANDKTLQESDGKIKQDQRNLIRKELLDIVAKELSEKLANDKINVDRVQKGVVITLDNEKVGIIPIMIDLKFLGLDYDVVADIEDYEIKLREKAKAEQEKAKAKAEKIKADQQRRQQKLLEQQMRAESENK